MTKKLTHIILLIALPGILAGQNLTDVTVSGLVANKSTGQGVSGVLVEVINEADTTQRSVVITDASGRYTANLSGVVTDVAVESERTPLEFRLEQNYPNPFNPSTAIVFHVPEPSEVALVIYNTLGQKVRTLVNHQYSPGVYTAVWDAISDLDRGVSAGIYFYRLQVKDHVLTKKMVLLDGYAGGYFYRRSGMNTEGRLESLSKASRDLLITVRSRGARIKPFQQNHIPVVADDYEYDIEVDVIIDEGLNPDLIAVSEPDQSSKVFISGMSNAIIDSLDGSESVKITNLRTGAAIATAVGEDRSIALKVLDGQVGDEISMSLSRSGNQVDEDRIFQILGDKPPVVTTTKPTNGEKDIVIGTRVYIHFSEPIDPSTLSPSSFNVAGDNGVISGSIELEEGNTVAVFTPQQPLSPNTTYSITVTTEVQDFQGLGLLYGFNSAFTTDDSEQQTQAFFWQPTYGPFGGTINALTRNSKGFIFAGTESGGVFRSSNSGESWTGTSEGLPDTPNWGPLHGEIVDLVSNQTGDVFAWTWGRELFRSRDNGESWTLLNTGTDGTNFRSVAVAPNGAIYAGSRMGIFRSSGNGDTWALIDTTINADRIAFQSNGNILVAGDPIRNESSGDLNDKAVFLSNDHGQSWTNISEGLFGELNVSSIAVNDRDDIFVGLRRDGFPSDNGARLFRSTDNGNNWFELNSDFVVWDFAINAAGDIFAATRNGVFLSTDNGTSWTQKSIGLAKYGSRYPDITTIIITDDNTIVAGTGWASGIFRSVDNGDTWQPANQGLVNPKIKCMTVGQNGDIFVGTGTSGVFGGGGTGLFRSRDLGNTWEAINNGLAYLEVRTIGVSPDGTLFTNVGGIVRSADNGDSWSIVDSTKWVGRFAFNRAGDIFAGGRNAIFRSMDNGDTWDQLNPGITGCEEYYSIAINRSGHIFVEIPGHCVEAPGGILRSSDNGESWTVLKTSSGIISVKSSLDLDDIYMCTGQGVFRSTDYGDSWTRITDGLPATSTSILGVDTEGNIFYVCFKGVYRSSDNGNSWDLIAGSFDNMGLAFGMSPTGDIFATSSNGRGVYRLLQVSQQ